MSGSATAAAEPATGSASDRGSAAEAARKDEEMSESIEIRNEYTESTAAAAINSCAGSAAVAAVLVERQATAPAAAHRYSRVTPGGITLEIEVRSSGIVWYRIDGQLVQREDFEAFDRFGTPTAGPHAAYRVGE